MRLQAEIWLLPKSAFKRLFFLTVLSIPVLTAPQNILSIFRALRVCSPTTEADRIFPPHAWRALKHSTHGVLQRGL